MEASSWLQRYYDGRYTYFNWRYRTGVLYKVMLAMVMAGVTGLVAQIHITLPWTPVPITGQTFAVLLAGVLLGRWYGGLSQVFYAGLGAGGVHWFAGWSGGWGVFTGATGGFIVGFIFAAFFIGYVTDSFVRTRSFVFMLALMLFANFVIIHGLGLWQLNRFLTAIGHPPANFSKLLWLGTVPFILGDITKAVAAALVVKAVTPKVAYSREKDAQSWQRWPLP